jgi:hypothetical protein
MVIPRRPISGFEADKMFVKQFNLNGKTWFLSDAGQYHYYFR